MVETFFFYLFSSIIIFSAIMVVSSRNPVHSVLFLILSFFNAAGLFVMLKAEFLAMMLVIVYVGAVAVLFLFVVMMLNIKYEKLKQGFQRYLPIGITIGLILLIEILFVINGRGFDNVKTFSNHSNLPNTHVIGSVLYTDYIYLFQVSGLILLVAMIGAIVLTLRDRKGVKKQSIIDQNERLVSDVIKVVKVEGKK